MTGLETNILVYSCDQRDPRRREIALHLIHRTTDGVILWQVACEFVAVSRKLAGQGFSPRDAWMRLAELLQFFPLALPTPAVLEQARILHTEYQWSFWDAILIGACFDAGVTRLYSEDLPGRAPPRPLGIVNPFA